MEPLEICGRATVLKKTKQYGKVGVKKRKATVCLQKQVQKRYNATVDERSKLILLSISLACKTQT